MEKAAVEEKKRKAGKGVAVDKKRPNSDSDPTTDAKRVKLEKDAPNILASFDFTTLPQTLITDLIVANLNAFSEARLIELVRIYKEKHGLIAAPTPPPPVPKPSVEPKIDAPRSAPIPPPAPVASSSNAPRSATPPTEPTPKIEEPVDPLSMDIDQEELEFEPDRLNEEV